MAGIVVRRMVDADRDDVGDVLGYAFADQSNTLAIARGDPVLAERLALDGMRVATLGRSHKNLWVAEDAGSVVGVLNAVEWPNCQMSLGEKLRTALAMLIAMGSAVPRGFRVMSPWARRDPQRRHWHLGPIGVAPDRQGRGIGSAMLSEFLGMSDAHGSPCYLETDRDRNLPLHQRFGFAIVGEDDILGVRNWYMWRDPREGCRPHRSLHGHRRRRAPATGWSRSSPPTSRPSPS